MCFEARAALVSLLLAACSAASAADLSDPVYVARCQMCHQSHGEGLPGQFPRLSGRVDKIAATLEGRRYLILVVLHGMAGSITVDGSRILGVMPSMAVLTDAQIASLLNTVSATDGKKPVTFTAAEVAKVRDQGSMSSSQTAAERARLAVAGLVP